MSGHMHKFGNIVVIKFKILQLKKVLNIFKVTGNKIIHGQNVVSFANKSIAQM